MEDHEERQLRHDIHQIKQYAGCLVTTGGLIWILLACILALLAFGCDMAAHPPPGASTTPETAPEARAVPDGPIDTVRVIQVTCESAGRDVSVDCGDLYWAQVIMTGGHSSEWAWAGQRLTLTGAVDPDTLRLPDDPVAASSSDMPQVVYRFFGVVPAGGPDSVWAEVVDRR